MNMRPIEQALDPDLRLSVVAMQRAALRAHELARVSGTGVVISRNGVVELLDPDSLVLDAPRVQEPPTTYRET